MAAGALADGMGVEPGGGAMADTVAVDGTGCWDLGGTYVPAVVTLPLFD